MAKLLLAGALMRMAGAFLAEIQLAVRAVAQKHREEASGKRVQDWQPGARLETSCTAGKEMHEGRGVARLARRCTTGKEMHEGRGVVRQARKCTMGEALHDGQAPPRQGSRWHIGLRAVARYFCLGGALRGYILSITSIGTPRIRCNCLFVAE